MKERTMTHRIPALLVAVLLGGAPAASAAVIATTTRVEFFGTTTTFSFGSASFTLDGLNPDVFNPVAVTTGGTGLVNALGAPFFDPPRPSSFFTNRGDVVFGPGQLYIAFPTRAIIPFSLGDTFIGLAVAGPSGTQYGYARFNSTTLLGYGFETDVGVPILAGAPSTAIPAPAAFGLLGLGLLGLIGVRRATS